MRVVKGFPEEQRALVAQLFWQAFSGKLGRIMAPEAKALDFIAATLTPERAICALSEEGALLGVAGFKTPRGGLITAAFGDLRRSYGLVGAAWRGPLLDLTERPLRPGELLMDGLFVADGARGQGIGTALIDAVLAEARARGAAQVRLDVIDSNLRARALYERRGFVPDGRTELGICSWLFGFSGATTMRRSVGATPA